MLFLFITMIPGVLAQDVPPASMPDRTSSAPSSRGVDVPHIMTSTINILHSTTGVHNNTGSDVLSSTGDTFIQV